MRDFLDRELNVGDTVVFVQLGYRNLLVGTIARMTPKTILIAHDETNVCSRETKQFPSQVVKIIKPTAKEVNNHG